MTAQITRLDIGEIQRLASELSIWRHCATVKAVNWTPWWGGGHDGYVRDPASLEVKSLPRSETVKGVLRWVLRAALNAALDASIAELDEHLAEIYGGVRRRGEGREEHLDSMVRIIVEAEYNREKDEVLSIRREIDECIQRGRMPRICWEPGKPEYLKILDVARVRLAFMKRSNESPDELVKRRRGLLPAPPETITATIRIDVRGDHPQATDICALSLLALIYALEVRGLGRGSTRGFGRFRVKKQDDIVCGELLDTKACAELKKLAFELLEPGTYIEAIDTMHKKLTGYARKVLNLQVHRGMQHSMQRLAPSFSESSVARRLIPLENAEDIYEALLAIGDVTRKQTWKKALGLSDFSPGVNLHTWILGLPRWQQATGYATVKENAEMRMCTRDLCAPEKWVNSNLNGNVRRASGIVLYPLPPAANSSLQIALIGYETFGDHLGILKTLYHVGAHSKRTKNCVKRKAYRKVFEQRKRPSPADLECRHVVLVAYAISSENIGPGNVINKCAGCCGKDAGGIYLGGEKPLIFETVFDAVCKNKKINMSDVHYALKAIYGQAYKAIENGLSRWEPPSAYRPQEERREAHPQNNRQDKRGVR